LPRNGRAFLFSDRQQLAVERDGNKKALSSRVCGSKAFSLLSTHMRKKPNEVRLNPPCFLPPNPPREGLNQLYQLNLSYEINL
jgi:hypothetical protein